MSTGLVRQETSGENLLFASGDCQHSLVYGHSSPITSSVVKSLCLSLIKTHVSRVWPTKIMQDNLSISISLTLITSSKILWPYKVTFTDSRA